MGSLARMRLLGDPVSGNMREEEEDDEVYNCGTYTMYVLSYLYGRPFVPRGRIGYEYFIYFIFLIFYCRPPLKLSGGHQIKYSYSILSIYVAAAT